MTLTCSSTNSAGYHIVWTEFASTPGGAKISDNDVIDASHPNAGRYQIVHGTAFQFDLVISNVALSDGGTYLCEDLNAVSPEKTRGQAELIVFGTMTIIIMILLFLIIDTRQALDSLRSRSSSGGVRATIRLYKNIRT